MLVFAAFTPHPPFLIPALGKENFNKLEKTATAMKQIAADFLAARPEVVIIISPHGQLMEKAFTINTAPNITAEFKKFGALDTNFDFNGDVATCYQIKEFLETKLPVQLITAEKIDYGASVPLFYLLAKDSVDPKILSLIKKIKIIPLGYSALDYQSHATLGHYLAEFIKQSPKRIALIGSGELSHSLSDISPNGFNANGQKFDEKITELITNKNQDELLQLDSHLIEAAKECGLKSLIIILHALKEINYLPVILSYEYPFGIGYLTVNFHLNQ
ncbi:MAG TPA: AmmeMemoRadiSam system protein B [bacterium]|nr:AmmeMemoRadiSam system protein B [bacterium]HPL95767.1 AmmeMemoRadiSam system protein B [bacterium]